MESVISRHRNLIIFLGVLFLQVLGLAVQVKRSADAENTRLIRLWSVSAITPLERGLVWAQNGTSNLWHNYLYLRGVRAENRELKQQIEQMRLEQVRLSEDAAQARRLQAVLSFKEQFVFRTVAAQVIGSSGSDSSRILYIDKGENDGLARDMAVVTADGIVGKVLQVFPSVSQVLLINDQSSGVGAILEKSRLQGVLKGSANGELMLERLMSDEQVAPGETVLTSGGDQIFPKGLPVGTVAKVGTGKDLFLNIRIRPAASLSRLEEVLVVTEKQQRQATARDTVRMRAADILAQRLPSVPERPAMPNAGLAAGTTGSAPSEPSMPGGNGGARPQAKAATVPLPQSVNSSKKQNPHGSAAAIAEGITAGKITPTPATSGGAIVVLEPRKPAPKTPTSKAASGTTQAPSEASGPKPANPQASSPDPQRPAPVNPPSAASDDSPH